MRDENLRRRLGQLEAEIKHERQQHISRAVEYQNHGDPRMAAYHTGLADGRNSVLTTLRTLAREYPADRESMEMAE